MSERLKSTALFAPEQPYTIALIKSNAMRRYLAVPILCEIVKRGFLIARMQQMTLCPTTVRAFYHEHVGRSYYENLERSVSLGPVLVLQLMRMDPSADVITDWRDTIGSSNAQQAKEGTLRNIFGGFRYVPNAPIADNALHGSDSAESAAFEFSVLFKDQYAQTPAISTPAALAELTRIEDARDLTNQVMPLLAPMGGVSERVSYTMRSRRDTLKTDKLLGMGFKKT